MFIQIMTLIPVLCFSLEGRGLSPRCIHTRMYTNFPDENSRHHLHSSDIRKRSIYKIYDCNYECKVYLYSYHLTTTVNLVVIIMTNYVKILLYIQFGMITCYKILVILLLSKTMYICVSCRCVISTI